MGEIRVVLIFNEDNERQREIGKVSEITEKVQNSTDYENWFMRGCIKKIHLFLPIIMQMSV